MGVTITVVAIVLLTVGFASPMTVVPRSHPGLTIGGGSLFPGSGLTGRGPNDHIQHVITVMQENHDYDSYFGTYCQTLGPYCSSTGNGIPANSCIPYYPTAPSYGCVTPYNLTPADLTIPDMYHDWYSGGVALDNGAMDGFYQAEGTSVAFGHYNQTTIPIFWNMAEQYGMSDNFWGGNLSWSLPNHWYLIAGNEPSVAYNNYVSGYWPAYLDQANKTRTVQDLLNKTAVSWKYYDTNLASTYSQAISGTGVWGTAYDFWNPMAARAESYNASYIHHFVPRSDLLRDLARGSLPNVSWVIPDVAYSSHPGWNESDGQTWIAQLVNAVESSPYWNSTVIFVTWDDYGGFYEHVRPRMILNDLLSFRAPLLVISPYARENFISHTSYNFMSLLRFVEWQFGLGCLNPLDCLAGLPLDFFDFNQTARAPILFGTYWNSTTYPMPLQGALPLNLECIGCRTGMLPGWETAYPAWSASTRDGVD